MAGDLERGLGERSAAACWWGNRAARNPAGVAYGDARALTGYDGGWRLARQVGKLRAAWQATPEYRESQAAAREVQAYVAAHETELAARREEPPASPEAWREKLRELESEADRLAPLVPDPDRPNPWDYQLALDELQGFLALCPEPEAEPEAG